MMTNATVLTLHGIECEALSSLIIEDPSIERYTISSLQYGSLLSLLSSRDCYTVQELTERSSNNSIVLTFDDGFISDYEMALPLLEKYNIKATFYITAKNIGKSGYCDKTQLSELCSAGMEIGSHGLTHRYLTLMPDDESRNEIKESKDIIEQTIGKAVNSYAAVGGHFREWMVDYALQSGYKSFATMIPGRTENSSSNILKLQRNHLQASHDAIYFKSLIEADNWFFLKNKLHYYALYLPKVILGMRNYDRLKGFVLGNEDVVSHK